MRILSLAIAGFLAAPALADTPMYEVSDGTMLPGLGISADIAGDLDVFDTSGREIGEVEDVVGASMDVAEALVVEFEDGVADYGREDRVIPLAHFTFDGSAVVLDDEADVLSMPVWDD
ncbi:MAG: hypothetical protein WEB56_11850 [Roseovarius sp.]